MIQYHFSDLQELSDYLNSRSRAILRQHDELSSKETKRNITEHKIKIRELWAAVCAWQDAAELVSRSIIGPKE